MMTSNPQVLEVSNESVEIFPKRKRRFKIFDNPPKTELEKE